MLDKENIKLDAAAWWLFGEQLRQPWLTPIMESFSALATPVTLLVVLGVAAAFTPVKRPGWCNVLNLGLVVLLNQAMKFAIQPAPRCAAAGRRVRVQLPLGAFHGRDGRFWPAGVVRMAL